MKEQESQACVQQLPFIFLPLITEMWALGIQDIL